MKPRILHFLPAIVWFLLSFYLLTLPGKDFPKLNWFDKIHGDKFVHIAMFGILVFLFLLPFKQRWNKPGFLKTAVAIAAIALLYGIAMEYVQENFIPNRSFDIGDILADAAGSFIPVALLYRYIKQMANR
jgi:VanZ family protein